MTPIHLIEHAAALLDREAVALRKSCTPDNNGDFTGEPEAKAAHDEFKTTALGLYTLADEMRQIAADLEEQTHA